MRFLNYKFLPLLISIFLFIIPFFWLKPGWIDLGGDSSRLYFYDPLNYLNSLPLYGITPDGIGTVVTGYFLLPFVVLLLIFKNILSSSYLLITLFNSFSLVVSFVSIYFITLTLLEEFKKEKIDKSLAGSLAGLFYIFSPILTTIGWEKALTVHNQIFLNPLMFLLLLKYIHSKKIGYLFIALLISFVFAPNFSPSPYLLAFFPLAVLFLLIYASKIKKTRIKLREITFSMILFIGIHLFHLLPIFLNFFSQNSAIFSATFSDQGKLVRGLSYFLSVAENIKLTNNVFSLSQNVSVLSNFNFLWVVFPLIILIGLLINKKKKMNSVVSKTFLLLSLFFLITLFFNTANITSFGLSFYKSLFNIPGFSMFRNYWGQFGHVFIFFYTLLLGQALFYIFLSVKDAWKKVLFFGLSLLIIVNSWSFIKGDVINLVLNPGSKNEVRIPIKMDTDYEKFLDFIRKDPIDAKYVTLPLTDTAYQTLGGLEGGAYIGPSTIAYLGGKKDFSGYQDFFPYHDIFLDLVKKKDYSGIKKLFSILNIKYVFYNSDPNIYNNFKYPFGYIKTFFPTVESYKNFILNLDFQEKYHIGKYYLYSVKDENFLPHFYAPKKIVGYPNITEDWESLSSFYSFSNDRLAIDSSGMNLAENQVIKANKVDIYTRINKDFPLPVYYPFAKWKLNSPIYPLIVFKESYSLDRHKKNDDTYIDRVLFYNSKRISELAKWEGGIPVLRNLKNSEELIGYYQKPQGIFDYTKRNNYNSWESVLSRYAQGLEDVTDFVNNSKNNLAWKYEKKSKITESLKNNKILFNIIINNSVRSSKEKRYLLGLTDGLFSYYLGKFKVKDYNPSELEYVINGSGKYDLYVQKDIENIDLSESKLIVGDSSYFPSNDKLSNSWIKYDGVNLNGQSFLTFNIPRENIAGENIWEKTSNITISNSSSSASLQTLKLEKDNFEMFVRRVTNFDDNSHYLLSFDYLTYGDTFEISLHTKDNSNKDSTKLPSYLAQFQEQRNTRKWSKFNLVFSSQNLKEAVIGIKPTAGKAGDTRVDIKDFSVIKLPPQPDIIAKRVEEQIQTLNVPKITFEKINPTKYKVKVTDARSPYTLVFLDAFDKGWKAYVNSENIDKNKTVASYFNGDIKQELSKNIFLDRLTFETWSKNPISENNHFMVNGYANAWNINPSSVENKTSYKLIIELQNQKIFYVSLSISLLSVFICIILLLKKYNEK